LRFNARLIGHTVRIYNVTGVTSYGHIPLSKAKKDTELDSVFRCIGERGTYCFRMN